MLILTLRTDKPEAEIALYKGEILLEAYKWEAHRKLAETLHTKIQELLIRQHKAWRDIEGVATYVGPGSFTGLRIGLSVINTIAAFLNIPCVGTGSEVWQSAGIQQLLNGDNGRCILPLYGAPATTTLPRK